MATINLDALGINCSQLILKLASATAELKKGDILEVLADCSTVEKTVRIWCERTKRPLLWIREEESAKKRCQIQC